MITYLKKKPDNYIFFKKPDTYIIFKKKPDTYIIFLKKPDNILKKKLKWKWIKMIIADMKRKMG